MEGSNAARRKWYQRKNGPLEVVVVLYILPLVMVSPATEQYIYSRLLRELSPLNESVADWSLVADRTPTNGTFSCHFHSKSKENDAQRQTSNWMLWLTLGIAATSLFSTFTLGSYSDARGRRLGLVLPSVGASLRCVFLMAVIFWELPLPFIVLGAVLEGCCGSFATLLMSAFSHIADKTCVGVQRTNRIVLLEVLLGISAACGALSVGFFIKDAGYLFPSLFATIILLANVAYTLAFVPESLQRLTHWRFDPKHIFCNIRDVYVRKTPDQRRWKLWICLAVVFLTEPAIITRHSIDTLYELRSPFCWDSVKIGIYAAICIVVQMVLVLVITRKLQGIVSKETIAISGCISGTFALVWQAFSTTDFQLYVVPVMGMLSLAVMPMARALMSGYVDEKEQGTMFSALSCVQLFTQVVGSMVVYNIYTATVGFMAGFVYLVLAACLTLGGVFLGILYTITKRESATSCVEKVLDDVHEPKEITEPDEEQLQYVA